MDSRRPSTRKPSRSFAFALIVGFAPLIGGAYGILHDQLTYTISPEYYTKFKFFQFGLLDIGSSVGFPHPRLQVSFVGFMATWWMGIPIGLVLALVALIHKEARQMLRVTMNAFLLTITVAFLTGLTGLLYGKYYLAGTGVSWWLPEDLADKESFTMVGSMHNFSYAGGLIGLLAGVAYSLWKRFRSEQADARAIVTDT